MVMSVRATDVMRVKATPGKELSVNSGGEVRHARQRHARIGRKRNRRKANASREYSCSVSRPLCHASARNGAGLY